MVQPWLLWAWGSPRVLDDVQDAERDTEPDTQLQRGQSTKGNNSGRSLLSTMSPRLSLLLRLLLLTGVAHTVSTAPRTAPPGRGLPGPAHGPLSGPRSYGDQRISLPSTYYCPLCRSPLLLQRQKLHGLSPLTFAHPFPPLNSLLSRRQFCSHPGNDKLLSRALSKHPRSLLRPPVSSLETKVQKGAGEAYCQKKVRTTLFRLASTLTCFFFFSPRAPVCRWEISVFASVMGPFQPSPA